MLRFILVIFIGVIFVGCNDVKRFSAPVFNSTSEAQITILSASDEVLPFSDCIDVSDSLITIAGLLDGSLFHTYNRKTGEPVGHYVDRGQGPDDMVLPGKFVHNDKFVIVQDLYSQVIKKFDGNWKCVSTELLNFNKMEINAPRAVRPMPDGKFFISVFVESYMPLGMQIKDGDKYGQVYSDFPVNVEYQESPGFVYDRIVLFSPDAKKMAAVSAEGLIFETFDIDCLQIKRNTVRFYYPFEMEKPDGSGISPDGYKKIYGYDKSNIKGINTMTSTDKRIVAAYNDTSDSEGSTDITVWDWEARPLKRFHTDKIILAMALSPDDPDEVYALVTDKDDEVQLVLFNCPGLLD